MQQKLQEIQTTNGQLPTRTCEAEEDGGHEQNRSPMFKTLQMDTFSCPHKFVSTCVRDSFDNCQR